MGMVRRGLLLAGVAVVAGVVAGFPLGCSQQVASDAAKIKWPFQDPTLPLEDRVSDLVSRMTLAEKVGQMQQSAPAIDRLGLPAYHWWSEALHGVARNGVATVFPQAIGLAATWDTDLQLQVGTVIGDEARAKHHEAVRQDKHVQYAGLDLWSPNINIFRDPRWGRGQETYGEDPYLTGRFGVAFTEGVQGNDPKYFKAIATPKHFAVHSGPETERHRFNAVPSQVDLWSTYLPAFEACVREGKAYSVMAAYSELFGQPCCANPWLLHSTLREAWGFEGYVVSDVDAIHDIYQTHQFVDTPEEASALGVKAGCDLNGGGTYATLNNAVHLGLISEREVDVSLKRLMRARFKLGMFDPPEMVPYASIPFDVNDSRPHDQLARQAARESMVLLKNDGNMLPLRKDLKTLAVIGPSADSLPVLLGNYHGTPSHPVTILQGIRNAVSSGTRVIYVPGSPFINEQQALEEIIPGQCLFPDANRTRHGLRGNYYNNETLAGRFATERVDDTVDFNWSLNPPLGLPKEEFSVRWTGVMVAPETGSYLIGAGADDGFRLYLDGNLIIDDWAINQKHTRATRINLEKDHIYALKLEYVQVKGDSTIQLRWTRPTAESPYAEAVRAAKSADAVIVALGINAELEEEETWNNNEGFWGGDRTTLDLPRVQEELLQAVAATGKPLVVVLTSGSALSVNWAAEHAPAIVQAWYPGQHGDAVADVLFGNYNPAGRLPVTFYKSVDDLPPFEDYAMEGRTYRYFRGTPLWPFGYGLSYTSFEYSGLQATPTQAGTTDNITVRVKVKNSGQRAGDEVAQLYLSRTAASAPTPIRTLVGFKRVPLAAGEEKTVQFTVTPLQLAVIESDGRRVVEPGEITFQAGGSSAAGQTQTIRLDGTPKEPAFGYAAPRVQ